MISGLSVGLAKIFGVTVMLHQPILHYITFTSTQFDSLLCCLMGPGGSQQTNVMFCENSGQIMFLVKLTFSPLKLSSAMLHEQTTVEALHYAFFLFEQKQRHDM